MSHALEKRQKFDVVAKSVGPEMRTIPEDVVFEADPKPDDTVRFDSIYQIFKNRLNNNVMGGTLKATGTSRTGFKFQFGRNGSATYDLSGWLQKTLQRYAKQHPESVVENNSNILFVCFKADVVDNVWKLTVLEIAERTINSEE